MLQGYGGQIWFSATAKIQDIVVVVVVVDDDDDDDFIVVMFSGAHSPPSYDGP